jgi:hypothetical protein
MAANDGHLVADPDHTAVGAADAVLLHEELAGARALGLVRDDAVGILRVEEAVPEPAVRDPVVLTEGTPSARGPYFDSIRWRIAFGSTDIVFLIGSYGADLSLRREECTQ